jgi:TM2 domain-containing membrane protein YozV
MDSQPPTPQPIAAATPVANAKPADGKSYLAAYLLTVFIGIIGGNRLYTGHTVNAWIRLLLFVLGIFAPFAFMFGAGAGVMGLVVSVIANTAVTAWWYVDLWLYYLGDVKDRKSGKPLVVLGKSDKAWAKNIMVSIHAAAILLPLILGLMIAIVIQQLPSIMPQLKNLGGSTNGDSSQQTQQILQQLQQLGL